ncbi:hypothetical protein BKA67DRAFT_557605 [Truncatella angustata]|uniref:Uncharacterized protein n=1 Tax=Truncatella angustata TaxID=152316 RepID=A0A9P8UTX0_9PEZI|nr:uncharacterized protein BKA67DRAFT_557605 [Truncatella angustata]KAH6658289.1 hypothetical protein BKA67DRAFT_557605 [Truncatella angustata]
MDTILPASYVLIRITMWVLTGFNSLPLVVGASQCLSALPVLHWTQPYGSQKPHCFDCTTQMSIMQGFGSTLRKWG